MCKKDQGKSFDDYLKTRLSEKEIEETIPSFPVTLIIHGEDGSTVTRWTVDNKQDTITIEKSTEEEDGNDK